MVLHRSPKAALCVGKPVRCTIKRRDMYVNIRIAETGWSVLVVPYGNTHSTDPEMGQSRSHDLTYALSPESAASCC